MPAGGLFVLAFELSFPVLVLWRRARPWLAVAGVAFHLLAGVLFRIPFVSLWALYVVLVDPRLLRRRPGKTAPASDSLACSPSGGAAGLAPRASPLTAAVGVALVAGALVQGARGQMRAFPFACYPTFQWMVGTEMPDLVVEIETADGRRVELPHARDRAGYRRQRQWGQIWRLAGVTGPVRADRLRAYYDDVRRFEPARSLAAGAVRARFYRAHVSVAPERRGARAGSDVLLLDLPLASLTPS